MMGSVRVNIFQELDFFLANFAEYLIVNDFEVLIEHFKLLLMIATGFMSNFITCFVSVITNIAIFWKIRNNWWHWNKINAN